MVKAAARDTKVLNFLVALTESMANGLLPQPSPLLFSRLTAATKKSRGIRPIACGETLYKIACSCVLNSVQDALAVKFAGIQYALGCREDRSLSFTAPKPGVSKTEMTSPKY